MRNTALLELVRELLISEVAFQELFKKYRHGKLRFSDIASWVDDQGHSLLFRLKELSHRLFRNRNKKAFCDEEGLLDLVIGSIFHEAMKLRENVYQLEIYRPQYLQYKTRMKKRAYEKNYLQQFERIITRAEEGVLVGMAETHSLFHDAMEQLIDLFKTHSKDPSWVRFLVDHQNLLKKIYGSKKTKEIFQTMFENGISEAYRLAGQSYLESEHYDLSSYYFSKALRSGSPKTEIPFLLHFSQGMDAYFKNAYSKVIAIWEGLLRSPIHKGFKKIYIKKMEEVCRKIINELEEEKRSPLARKAKALADQMSKMLRLI